MRVTNLLGPVATSLYVYTYNKRDPFQLRGASASLESPVSRGAARPSSHLSLGSEERGSRHLSVLYDGSQGSPQGRSPRDRPSRRPRSRIITSAVLQGFPRSRLSCRWALAQDVPRSTSRRNLEMLLPRPYYLIQLVHCMFR